MTRWERWAAARPFLVPSRRRIIALSVLAISGGFMEAAVVVLIVKLAFLVAQGGAGDDLGLGPFGRVKLTLPVLLLAAFALTVLRMGLQLVSSFISPRLTTDLDGRLRSRVIEAYLRSTWSKQSQEKEGQFLELAGAQVGRASSAAAVFTTGITQGFNLVALLLTALIVDVVSAAVVMFAVTVLFVALRPISRVSRRWSARQAQAGVRYTGVVQELLRSTQELKVFNVEDAVIARANGCVNDYEHAAFRSGFVRQMAPAIYQGAALTMILAGIALASVVSGAQVTALGAVVLLLFRALTSSQALQLVYHQMQELAPYLGRVHRAIDDYEAHRDVVGDIPLDHVSGIAFRNVSFSYPDGPEVIRDLSFEIDSGECIGVVGPSGAGKSTLVQLLLRLRAPTVGRICVNDVDLSEIEASSWFGGVALVPQDPLLIGGSIAENIRFFRDIPMPTIIEAAKRANLHEEVSEDLGGYEAAIGPRDRSISGGQRQRLALARALAGEPQLLILDEPTSALDLRSENAVHQSLSDLHGEVTLVIVAHRLSTLGICDRIAVLEKGGLTAYLPPDELAVENDFFRESVDLSRLGQLAPAAAPSREAVS